MKLKNIKRIAIRGILNKVYPYYSAISLNFYALFNNKAGAISMRKIHVLVSLGGKL